MTGTMRDVAAGMTIEQLIGQVVMVGFSGLTAPAAVLDLIAARHVGGIILFARNLRDANQTLALTRTLQQSARAAGHPAPLLIATDQENGIVRRLGRGATVFPGQMAQGAIADETVTHAIARATGEELRTLGITMNLAPVMDVANNPANPVIGVRAFGADPNLVARLGVAALHGYAAAGVVATLKHFPGHGDTATDSHLALPVIPHDMDRLETVELVPFRRGVAAGAPVVMTAHIALPALTGSDTLPATLAPEVIQGLLRERLGFSGVVMTDCLEMKAISETVGVATSAVRALRAGADLVLVSHRHDRQDAGIAAVRAAVESGEVTRARISEAAARVLRLKARTCSWDEWDEWAAHVDPADAHTPAHRELAEAAYARAVTLIRDDTRVLPLSRETTRSLLIVAQVGGPVNQAAGERPDEVGQRALAAALRRRQIAVDVAALPAQPTGDELTELVRRARAADAIILLSDNAYRHPERAHALLLALADAGRPLIGMAIGDPYDAAALREIKTWLATYEGTPSALEAAAAGLLGERDAQGTLPVSLCGASPS